jgi:hypothetical protein
VDRLDEIKRLYLNATPGTIARDLTRAIALLKEMPSEDERERAAVFMDGLSQMRSEWAIERKARGGGPAPRAKTPGS